MKKDEEQKQVKETKEQTVNENSGILIDEHIKIFDPNTNETLINKRGE